MPFFEDICNKFMYYVNHFIICLIVQFCTKILLPSYSSELIEPISTVQAVLNLEKSRRNKLMVVF